MGQPIRKNIQELHSDIIKEPPFRTLLVDGGSLLYKCFADLSKNSKGVIVGPIKQFLTQLRMQLEKGEFEYVYVFFDNEYSGVLRYQFYPYYKANRDKHYSDYGESEYMKKYNENLKKMQNKIFGNKKVKKEKSELEKTIDENFDRCRDVLCLMFNELYIRWNIDDITEGDDQIAYYCLNKKENEKIIIMSGDMDLSQLISDDIAIYNLNIKKYITKDNFKDYFGYHYENVCLRKIFCGDVSDNISNIKGLSEEGLEKLMPEIKTRKVTVEEVKKRAGELIEERVKQKKKPYILHENIINGKSNKEYYGDFYEINEKIINLKKPLLSNEAKETMD